MNSSRKSASGPWTVVDFFSGCGGMSYGFSRREPFKLIAAVDAEFAKPGAGFGKLSCNETYKSNIGIGPFDRDIAKLQPEEFLEDVSSHYKPGLKPGELTVFLCCPPCTDFSRTKPENHSVDSPKNSLALKCADFIEALRPEFVLMENARELIRGNHPHHYVEFTRRLEAVGYDVRGDTHFLTRFGLPQIRERALIVASRICPVLTLEDLWEGWKLSGDAVTVHHAIGRLNEPPLRAGDRDKNDPMHVSPGFASDIVRRRMEAIPHDGGSWFDLANHPDVDELLVGSMRGRLERGNLGSHPDVYGRMAWDKPAPTIKRECAHVGNGRYAHPEQDRLMTVREMALLQGFPADFDFPTRSLANRYRHIGDAVPPLISYQLSALIEWMKTGTKPRPVDWVLPRTSLMLKDIRAASLACPARSPVLNF
ncbi:MAG: DNA cytosine methyltransferase [Isosphaeraceae bacterium]